MEKIILITGGSRGIGKETAKYLSEKKHGIIITYNNNEKEARETKKICLEKGAKFVDIVKMDVRDKLSIEAAMEYVKNEYKEISKLVNNAGYAVWKYFYDQSIEDIEKQVRINLEGLIKVTHYFLPLTEEEVINIASGAGKRPHLKLSTYSATKFGVIGFTKNLAVEGGIKSYSINPNMTQTDMTNYQGEPVEDVGKVIGQIINEEIPTENGSDIDVKDYL